MGRDLLAEGGSVQLTEKQLETLDLLAKHMTSKEISRSLGISPHTVDQRIESAKRKFGASTRGELAQAYLRVRATYERLTHENPRIADPFLLAEQSPLDESEPISMYVEPEWAFRPEPRHDRSGYQVGLELFSGSHGTAYRISAIVLVALLLVIVILAGISIFVAMSQILAT